VHRAPIRDNEVVCKNTTKPKSVLKKDGILLYLHILLLHEFEQQSLLVLQNANLAVQLGAGAMIGAGTGSGDGVEIGVVMGTVIEPV
jgi:hypothetical protein